MTARVVKVSEGSPLKRSVGGPRRTDFLSHGGVLSLGGSMGSCETRRRGREEEKYASTMREMAERAAAVVITTLRRLEVKRMGVKRGESS